MPHQRRSLRKRKLPADVSSDDCDDDGDSPPCRIENDFPADDNTQHRMQRKTRTSVQNQQPKSERQQVALFRRLEAAEAGLDRPVSATFGRSAAGKRRGCGKNINWRNRHGETMLHKLVTYGTVEEIEQLIRQGADVNARDNADWTALHEASLSGLPDAVECLLKAGADVNVAADGGTTPLHDGAISGCLKVVELLLHHGADTSRTDKCCKTPLEVSSSDEVRNCLLDHLRRTTIASSNVKDSEPSDNSSCSNPKVSVVDAHTGDDRSRPPPRSSPPPQCPITTPPFLDNIHPSKRSTTDRSAAGDGPFTLFSHNLDPPRSFADYAGSRKESSPSSCLTSLAVDLFREQLPMLVSPATASVAVSASSSVVTLSSTSVTPSTSIIALSANPETRRVTRSRSHSIRDAGEGAGTGDGGVIEIIEDVEIGGGCEGDTGSNGGDGGRLRRRESDGGQDLNPHLLKNDSSLDCFEVDRPCSVTMYEDISDDEDAALPSCSASVTRPRELRPRNLCFTTNSNERNENSVGVQSCQMPDGRLIRDASKDKGRRSDVYDFHSYSQTEPSRRLPSGWFKQLKWKTSNCAARVGSGVEEHDVAQPGLGCIHGGRGEPKKICASPGMCFTGNKVPCGSGKARVFSGQKDLLRDLARKNQRDVSLLCKESIQVPCVQADFRIAADQKKGNILQKLVIPKKTVLTGESSPYRAEPHSLSGLRCDVCIPRPDSDTKGEGNDVIRCSNSALTEVNNNSANGFCTAPKPGGNRFQRLEASLVDRLDRSSDKPKPREIKSGEGQKIALKKMGKDVVVFLRRAAFDARPETKQFGVPDVTGVIGAESGHNKTSNDNVPPLSPPSLSPPPATISDQCRSERRFFSSDAGIQSGTEGLKRDAVDMVKQRIVLCNSLVKKESDPLAGSNQLAGSISLARSILHNGQKECAFDWNRSSSTLLVDKSTMTAESDWEPNESAPNDQPMSVTSGNFFGRAAAKTQTTSNDQPMGVTSGNFFGRAAAKTQTNITGEVSPVAIRNVTPEACTFQMCSGDWKTPAHPLRSFSQSSGFKKTSDIGSQSSGTVRFDNFLQAHTSSTPVSDSIVKLCGSEVHDRIASLPLLASYKTARRPKHRTDSASNTIVNKSDQTREGNGFAIPTTVTYPAVPAHDEPPTKVKNLSVCEKKEKLLDVCPSASFGGGCEVAEDDVSEPHRCQPFGKRSKVSTTLTLPCRKESAAASVVSAVVKNVKKKNAKNDRVVGHLEEDAPSDLHLDGSEMTDCSSSSRPTASIRRAAGFGSGITSGCGLGRGRGQTRIAKERAADLPGPTKANASREDCSVEQPKDGDDTYRSRKTTDFVLWHGLSSKSSGSLDSLINEREISTARQKPHFPKEFERFLMATREYDTQSSSQEISVPAGLDLPLRNLFIKQEKERLKLKQEQKMRWERLLLTIEAEVIREYVEEEKRLDAFRPLVNSCTILCHQNFCSRSHKNPLQTRPQENSLKSRLERLKEKFLDFELDMHFQLQNEISVLHSCQVQEWERMLTSYQPPNSSHMSPQLCVSKVANLRCLVSAFFDKLNLFQ